MNKLPVHYLKNSDEYESKLPFKTISCWELWYNVYQSKNSWQDRSLLGFVPAQPTAEEFRALNLHFGVKVQSSRCDLTIIDGKLRRVLVNPIPFGYLDDELKEALGLVKKVREDGNAIQTSD